MNNSNVHPHPVLLSGPLPEQMREVGYGSGLKPYIAVLYDSRWLILCVALAVMLLGSAYALFSSPPYVASMLLHVEEDGRPNGTKNILDEISSTFDVKSTATSEMELLRSRLVILRAVDNLHLYIDSQPKYFPIIGTTLAQRSDGLSVPGLFGRGGYVWGAEKIRVPVFNVPDVHMNRRFVLTADSNNQYRLSEPGGEKEWRGQVGKPLLVSTATGNIELQVDQIDANPGAQFYLQRAPRLSTAEAIQKNLTIAEQGKQSGVIGVTLKGEDPKLLSETLNAIGREYLLQNQARKTEEAEKSLRFLDTQLPDLKRALEQSEAKYNQFRASHGTIDLSEEGKIGLQQLATVKNKRLDLEQRRMELQTRFTPEHPAVDGINAQIKEMDVEIATISAHIKKLPVLEQELLVLNRDIKVNTELYTALSNTAQKLRLVTAGKVSNVRLVDASMAPEKPSRSPSIIVKISVFLGLLLGCVTAFVRKMLRGTVDDPDQIERMFGVPVYATIPHSNHLKTLSLTSGGPSERLPLLINVSSADAAIESLRSFSNALRFSMMNSKSNVVMMTGATPGVGKSFVSANLAAITATSGKRVLLVDADLRNGHLHKFLNLARQGGLAEYIAGHISVDKIIHRGVMPTLDFISTGNLPSSPSDLLLRPRFGELIQSLSSNYDLILVDSTPILGFSDALIVGAQAGSIYVLTRAGVTTENEVRESMIRLRQSGLSAKGILLNDMEERPGRYGYGYGASYGKAGAMTGQAKELMALGSSQRLS